MAPKKKANNDQGSNQPNSGPNSGNRRRNPRQDPRTRRAGRVAASGNTHVQTPEEQRARLQQQLGRTVMTHVMDRVKTRLGTNPTPADADSLRQKVDSLAADFAAAGGDADQLKSTIGLLDLDDTGVKMITEFLANASKGLETDDGRMFYAEAHASTQKIIDDLIENGRARIVGPDGKFYDMELIAIDKNETVDDMPDCLGNKLQEQLAASEPFDIAGTYAVGGNSMLLPNMLHGEIIAESELLSLKTALDEESDVEYTSFTDDTHTETMSYKFHRTDETDPIVAQLPPAYREFVQSPAGAYSIEFNAQLAILPTTAWYANHRATQWNVSRHTQPGAVAPEPTQPASTTAAGEGTPTAAEAPAPTASSSAKTDGETIPAGTFDDSAESTVGQSASSSEKKVAIRVNEVKAQDIAESDDPTKIREVRKRIAGAVRGYIDRLQQRVDNEAKANELRASRREIYNSAINYLEYAIPRSLAGNISLDDINGLVEYGSGEDSYGKVQGEHSTLFALSDGMGGAADGATASRLTAEAFLQDVGLTKILDEDAVRDVISRAVLIMQKRIVTAREKVAAFNRDHNSDSGATVVAAEVIGDKLVYGSVGDSTIFVVRNGKFILVAGDRGGHSNGIYTSIGNGEAFFNPVPPNLQNSNVDELSRLERAGNPAAADKISAISGYDNVGVFNLEDGDRVVLCSDGIMGDWSLMKSLFEGYRDDRDRERAGRAGEQTLTDEEIVEAVGKDTVNEAMVALMKAAKKVDDRSVQMFDIKLQD